MGDCRYIFKGGRNNKRDGSVLIRRDGETIKLLRNPDHPYSPSSPPPRGREATTGNASAVEEGWYGQLKYCYEKVIHVVTISFAVVFGLLVSSAPKRMFNKT